MTQSKGVKSVLQAMMNGNVEAKKADKKKK